MIRPVDFLLACDRIGIDPTRFVLAASIARQSLLLFENTARSRGCKTADPGVGQPPIYIGGYEAGFKVPMRVSRIVEAPHEPPLCSRGCKTAAPGVGQPPIYIGGYRAGFRVPMHVSWIMAPFHEPSPPRATPKDFHLLREFRCSTSRFGISQVAGSNGTPLGLHRVAKKRGGGWPVGAVFKGRKPIGYTWQGMPDAKITTRILWLEGLEPGFNRGGKVDSHARYIYVHGTGDEPSLGRPASCGCIHLAADDLIPLFDKLPLGTLVWISR